MTTSPSNIITRRDAWRTLWRIVTSDWLLAASLLGISLALAAAAILPQAPVGDATAYARWLSDTQLRFSGAAGGLSTLGLFDVAHSFVFRILAGFAGFAVLIRLIDLVLGYRASTLVDAPPDSPAQSITSDADPDVWVRSLHGWRMTAIEGGFLADRFRWSRLGPIVAHGGAIIMLLGLMVSPLTDWRVDALSAQPGRSIPVPNTPYSLEVSDVNSSGQVSFTLRESGQPVISGVAAPGQPVLGRAASVFVEAQLPALRVRGQTATGQPLDLQTRAQGESARELLLTFDPDQPDEFFVAPIALLAVRVTRLESGADSQTYKVSIVRTSDASQVLEESIRPGDQVDANGVRFAFQGAAHAIVSVVYAPSQIVIVAGLVLILIGLTLMAVFPARRIWIVAHGQGARLINDQSDLDLLRLKPESWS